MPSQCQRNLRTREMSAALRDCTGLRPIGATGELENVVERRGRLFTSQDACDADMHPESIRSKELVERVAAAALGILTVHAWRVGLRSSADHSISHLLVQIMDEIDTPHH